jgi:hypothetical protein
MALVNLDNSKDLVKNTYLALNILTLIAIASGFLTWFFVPFLTENSKDPKHQIVRILSLFYVMGAGGIGLFGANKLARLDRYTKAIAKAEDNNFINQLASSQYSAQKTLEGEAEYQIVLTKSENGMLPPPNNEEYDDLPESPKEINGVKIQDYHWEALELAQEKGELTPRDFQRSAIARRLEFKADDAKLVLEELAKANLGKLEEDEGKIKFLPVT